MSNRLTALQDRGQTWKGGGEFPNCCSNPATSCSMMTKTNKLEATCPGIIASQCFRYAVINSWITLICPCSLNICTLMRSLNNIPTNDCTSSVSYQVEEFCRLLTISNIRWATMSEKLDSTKDELRQVNSAA